jgi:hypothetical protein
LRNRRRRKRREEEEEEEEESKKKVAAFTRTKSLTLMKMSVCASETLETPQKAISVKT